MRCRANRREAMKYFVRGTLGADAVAKDIEDSTRVEAEHVVRAGREWEILHARLAFKPRRIENLVGRVVARVRLVEFLETKREYVVEGQFACFVKGIDEGHNKRISFEQHTNTLCIRCVHAERFRYESHCQRYHVILAPMGPWLRNSTTSLKVPRLEMVEGLLTNVFGLLVVRREEHATTLHAKNGSVRVSGEGDEGLLEMTVLATHDELLAAMSKQGFVFDAMPRNAPTYLEIEFGYHARCRISWELSEREAATDSLPDASFLAEVEHVVGAELPSDYRRAVLSPTSEEKELLRTFTKAYGRMVCTRAEFDACRKRTVDDLVPIAYAIRNKNWLECVGFSFDVEHRTVGPSVFVWADLVG